MQNAEVKKRKRNDDSITAQVVMKRGMYKQLVAEANRAGVSFSSYIKMIIANRQKLGGESA